MRNSTVPAAATGLPRLRLGDDFTGWAGQLLALGAIVATLRSTSRAHRGSRSAPRERQACRSKPRNVKAGRGGDRVSGDGPPSRRSASARSSSCIRTGPQLGTRQAFSFQRPAEITLLAAPTFGAIARRWRGHCIATRLNSYLFLSFAVDPLGSAELILSIGDQCVPLLSLL